MKDEGEYYIRILYATRIKEKEWMLSKIENILHADIHNWCMITKFTNHTIYIHSQLYVEKSKFMENGL